MKILFNGNVKTCFLEKIRKNIAYLLSAELAQRVVRVSLFDFLIRYQQRGDKKVLIINVSTGRRLVIFASAHK